ncbi:hypothetical protein Pedsa_1272 [Pseudopedobacter saltans DSM 12145]|uniref:Uncharacterized protein n=1 Tax=Pseudopedobacter saltans (strain ATCC 51119 / DSM 12145 / JCM 21818 / CCUG 39354 / LMG 10337 / NBRC 100064 / NCIMB 13643) TaxID=762903 RepID=F0SDU3_PSESL|nr:hypothetical protein [Pseudopedobacter saltans]ADY51839.1 hypothetical protein Pedsa_1272 [Pseudopedobacter saltans DSM 12145]
MLWNKEEQYTEVPFEKEADLEEAVHFVKDALFGSTRIYLDDKKKIGQKGNTNNLPDGYLIDLTNKQDPKIFVVENDLASHQHLKHIAVQILEFSLSFESSKVKVKNIIKEMLQKRPVEWKKCEAFAKSNGYENVDYLLESIIHKKDSFNALLIIDELGDELETVLISRFKFPVEVTTLKRYQSESGKLLYEFEPFLNEVTEDTEKIDISDIDTIVIPAREDGFKEVFIDENCWYAIRLNSSMIPKIKYIAAYQVAPISAITHIAEVKSIEQWKDTNKYILHFAEPAQKIKSIPLGKIKGKAPQSPRYSSRDRILNAKSLDNVF